MRPFLTDHTTRAFHTWFPVVMDDGNGHDCCSRCGTLSITSYSGKRLYVSEFTLNGPLYTATRLQCIGVQRDPSRMLNPGAQRMVAVAAARRAAEEK